MRIALLGANGRTGREVLERALDAGDTVTALVRSADKLAGVAHPRLNVCVGSPCSAAVLEEVLPGHDVVVSVLGPRWPSKSAAAIYPDSATTIVEAMHRSGVKRLLVTSSALLFQAERFVDRMLRRLVPSIVTGAQQMEESIRNSSVDWTIARTSFLKDTDETDYRLGREALPQGCVAVSRSAVATFLLQEAKQRRHSREVVGLCG